MAKQVILIMTDATRKDMLGCYGNEAMKTPNLDKLANEGIRYENAYTCQPVCGPSRSAIFTGVSPHNNGMVTNSVALREGTKTIGQYLSKNDIHCGYIGKWHLDGGDYFGDGICPEGWDPDYWYDMKTYLEELTPEERVRSRKPETSFAEDWNEEMTYGHRCSNKALNFLDKYSDKDFFLTISYDEPHGPFVCPEPYNTMYDGFSFGDYPSFTDDLKDKPLYQQLWAGEAINKSPEEITKSFKNMSLFLGCNSYADYEIGRVLDAVQEKAPNALIIYTSDHGDMLGAHRLVSKNATAYREVANIPLIIKGGEKGKVVDYPASHIDLVPTILDYMDVKLPKRLEGKSMVKQIDDASVKINDYVFTEFTRYEVDHDGFGGLQMMRAVMDERYKLVINLLDTDEFYDMENDPYEITNEINNDEYSEIRDKLHDIILDNMNETRDLYRGYQWAVRPWRKDKKPSWENDGYTRQRDNEEWEERQLDYDTGLPMLEATRKKIN